MRHYFHKKLAYYWLITATNYFDCNYYYYYSHWLFSIDHSHVIFAINSIMYKLYMNTFWYYSNGRAGAAVGNDGVTWWKQLSLLKETVNKRTADITHQTNVSEQNSEQFTAVTDNNRINIEQFSYQFRMLQLSWHKASQKVAKQRPWKRKSVSGQSLDIVKIYY